MDQLHLGIIGVSGRGGMARHWQDNPRAEVVAGMDVNSDALADFQERMGNQPFVTTDLEALLNRDDVEAVGVFSPDFTHEEYAVAALEAGKHVFCEKPLGHHDRRLRPHSPRLESLRQAPDGRLQHALYEYLPRHEGGH